MLTPIARRELRDMVAGPATDEPWKPAEWWQNLRWWQEPYPPPTEATLRRTIQLLRALPRQPLGQQPTRHQETTGGNQL